MRRKPSELKCTRNAYFSYYLTLKSIRRFYGEAICPTWKAVYDLAGLENRDHLISNSIIWLWVCAFSRSPVTCNSQPLHVGVWKRDIPRGSTPFKVLRGLRYVDDTGVENKGEMNNSPSISDLPWNGKKMASYQCRTFWRSKSSPLTSATEAHIDLYWLPSKTQTWFYQHALHYWIFFLVTKGWFPLTRSWLLTLTYVNFKHVNKIEAR